MAVNEAFADYLRDLLAPLGPIRLRRMFGGLGLYAGDLFFALVIDEQLYFKVDATTRPTFAAAGLEEWVYLKQGRPVHMNYFRPPEDVFDDEEALRHWGGLALAAAQRARKPAGRAPAAPRSTANGKTAPQPPARKAAAAATKRSPRKPA